LGVDGLHRVSLRVVTLPVQFQGTITRDDVNVDVSAVACFRVVDAAGSVVDAAGSVVDAAGSVVALENVHAAIGRIARTTLHKVVGQHSPHDILAETDRIDEGIRPILEATTVAGGRWR